MPITPEERDKIEARISQGFTPSSPVDRRALFAGRTAQIRRILDAVNQKGQHAIIFGERGVGKTSLTLVLSELLDTGEGRVLARHVNCDSGDDYTALWKKVFSKIEISFETRQIGVVEATRTSTVPVLESLPERLTLADVENCLAQIGQNCILIVIIDEFDRVVSVKLRRSIADTIKSFSDHAVPVTVILAGVADTIHDLIREHQSIERALAQIQIPRMSGEELRSILDNGLRDTGMTLENPAAAYIVALSQGLPHFAHLLGRDAARAALDENSLTIASPHVDKAIVRAVENAQESIISSYHKATQTPRKFALHEPVLLACALAKQDGLGYFAAADVRAPLSRILNRTLDIPGFARHLNEFCGGKRDRILQKTGIQRRFRYRFRDPLMQPYVIMQGLAQKLVSRSTLEEIQASQ